MAPRKGKQTEPTKIYKRILQQPERCQNAGQRLMLAADEQQQQQ